MWGLLKMFFDYDYFCGANIVLEIDGVTLSEAAAISFSAQESKIPLYGYSSRHFDAVAHGQVIIQGSLAINFVHPGYLFEVLRVAKGEGFQVDLQKAQSDISAMSPENVDELLKTIQVNPTQSGAVVEAMKNSFWDQVNSDGKPSYIVGQNPFDRADSCDITITFGERSAQNGYGGQVNLLISDVFFTGRGMPIQIDENVIVEEYSFFARNLMYLTNPVIPVQTLPSTGPEIDLSTEYSRDSDEPMWWSNPNLKG